LKKTKDIHRAPMFIRLRAITLFSNYLTVDRGKGRCADETGRNGRKPRKGFLMKAEGVLSSS
jgi:hypothetical protein